MLEHNYSAENTLKKWAIFFDYASVVISVISLLVFVVLLCVDAAKFWLVAILIFVCGVVSMLSLLFISNLTRGFAEIIGNTGRMYNGVKPQTKQIKQEELPEL